MGQVDARSGVSESLRQKKCVDGHNQTQDSSGNESYAAGLASVRQTAANSTNMPVL